MKPAPIPSSFCLVPGRPNRLDSRLHSIFDFAGPNWLKQESMLAFLPHKLFPKHGLHYFPDGMLILEQMVFHINGYIINSELEIRYGIKPF